MANSEYRRRFKLAAYTEKWAVTMTKVCIRQQVAHKPWPRWHFISFSGVDGGESRGVVDLIAIRKNHNQSCFGTKRGDTFQIILIQVKGGYAAKPTPDDGERLRIVARHHRACGILLAVWKKGSATRFFSLRKKRSATGSDWIEVADLKSFFN